MVARATVLIALAILALGASAAVASPEPTDPVVDATDTLPTSQEGLRVEYAYTAETLKRHQADAQDLERFVNLLNSSLTSLDAIKFDSNAEATGRIRRLKVAYKAIVDVFADETQELTSQLLSDLNAALSDLISGDFRLTQATAEFDQLTWATSDERAAGLINAITAVRYDYGDQDDAEPVLLGLGALYSATPFDAGDSELVDGLKAAITEAAPHVAALAPRVLESAFDRAKQAVVQEFTRMHVKATELRQAAQGRVDVARGRLATIDGTLADIKATEREAALAAKSVGVEKLFTAVYWMLGVLVVLFVTTIVARAKTESPVIDDRTLVEFAGMSFLLLTIIILASVELVVGETLGTLLGTMAGYIFGKSMQRAQVTPPRNRKRKPQQQQPQQQQGASP